MKPMPLLLDSSGLTTAYCEASASPGSPSTRNALASSAVRSTIHPDEPAPHAEACTLTLDPAKRAIGRAEQYAPGGLETVA